VDKLPDSLARLARECDELGRERLAGRRRTLAGPQAGNAEAPRRARACFDARQHEEGAGVPGNRQPDDHVLALRGQQQRRPLPAAAERLAGHGRRGSAAAAQGPQAR
jgi:hypothetical protein